jgi:myxalamid-type polyketide synthase MxaB
MSRGKPAGKAADQLTTWNKEGVRVVAIQGDVADSRSLAAALREIPAEFPALRGIIHAAGVLADGVMFDMELDQLDKPLRPKVQGAWNLHTATLDNPLDFFVLFSSVACVLGSPGQSNYAAANAFLDALAAYRGSRGLPALSVNWGPWADSGMAAEAGRDEQLAARGMALLPADKAIQALELLIGSDLCTAAVMSVNWGDLLRASGGRPIPPLLNDIAANIDLGGGADNAEDLAFRAELTALDVPKRKDMLNGYFGKQLAAIMGLEAEDIDVTQPLNTLGLDSLMAIELKNKIENKLRITLPMALFMKEPSVSTLADHVASTYGSETNTAASESSPSP